MKLTVTFELTEEFTKTEMVNALTQMARAGDFIAGVCLSSGKYTTLEPTINPILTAAAQNRLAAQAIDGPPQIAVPQLVPPQGRQPGRA